MKKIILALTAILILSACGSRVKKDDNEHEKYSIWNKNLITANKYLIKEDAERTVSYIKRRNWTMQESDGGLKFQIFEHGNGDSIVVNPKLSMKYRVELLDGTECYNSDKDGLKDLVVGSSDMETGLVKLFKNFCHGDSAVMILPPYFAKGLVGDMNKIPPHSVIVYYVRIL